MFEHLAAKKVSIYIMFTNYKSFCREYFPSTKDIRLQTPKRIRRYKKCKYPRKENRTLYTKLVKRISNPSAKSRNNNRLPKLLNFPLRQKQASEQASRFWIFWGQVKNLFLRLLGMQSFVPGDLRSLMPNFAAWASALAESPVKLSSSQKSWN